MGTKLGVILFSLCHISVMAQTATSFQLSQPGDSLLYLTDELPQKIEITAPGENQRWNYTNLKAPYLESIVVHSAESNLKTDLIWKNSDGSHAYMNRQDDGLYSTGGYSPDNVLGVQAEVSYQKGLPVYLNLPKYGLKQDFADVRIEKYTTSNLPASVASLVGRDIQEIELTNDIRRYIEADATGLLLLPGGQYESIRLRIEDNYNVTGRMLRKNGSWIPLNADLEKELRSKAHSVSYQFVDAGDGKLLAKINTHDDGVAQEVEFTMPPSLARYYPSPKPGQWLYAYPNPAATSTVRFKFADIMPGLYTIRFYNILGKSLMELPFQLDDNSTIEVSVGHLAKGTYLYSLMDPLGKKLITKRLVILKP